MNRSLIDELDKLLGTRDLYEFLDYYRQRIGELEETIKLMASRTHDADELMEFTADLQMAQAMQRLMLAVRDKRRARDEAEAREVQDEVMCAFGGALPVVGPFVPDERPEEYGLGCAEFGEIVL